MMILASYRGRLPPGKMRVPHSITVREILEFIRRQPPRLWGVCAVALAVLAMILDFVTWIELNVAMIYTLPLLVAVAARSRRLVWGLALVFTASTFIVYWLQMPAGAFNLHEQYFLDRVLSDIDVLLTAALMHVLSLVIDALDARNRQLAVYQQEITRRNQELDRLRREAEEASDRKTRLLMSVSHDIRSPLTTIHLMADLIRSTADEPASRERLPRLAQTLQTSALSLSRLVTDVLDISYFESGRIELRESEFSVNDLVIEECRRLQPLAIRKGLALTCEPAQPDIWLAADRVKLARVLSNLVTNAIQFTARGGATVSAALTAERGLLICVMDTGSGIAPENLQRIFGEFTRLRAVSDDDPGWGLGLAICKRLMTLMGGEIAAENRPGGGSVFKVHLPPSRVLDRTFTERSK